MLIIRADDFSVNSTIYNSINRFDFEGIKKVDAGLGIDIKIIITFTLVTSI